VVRQSGGMRARSVRPALCALVLLLAGGCGGAGETPSFEITEPIAVAPFGQGAVSTSATNRMSITHGTSVSFHVTEGIYTGNYTTTVVTNPPGSTCITISPAIGNYVFTVSVSASPSCTYPQTADITFADVINRSTTLYVQGV
jgi:hypothetical protein